MGNALNVKIDDARYQQLAHVVKPRIFHDIQVYNLLGYSWTRPTLGPAQIMTVKKVY